MARPTARSTRRWTAPRMRVRRTGSRSTPTATGRRRAPAPPRGRRRSGRRWRRRAELVSGHVGRSMRHPTRTAQDPPGTGGAARHHVAPARRARIAKPDAPDLYATGPTDRRPPFRFWAHARVWFSDTDAQGVVYYGRYLPYFDHARLEYHRHLGLTALWRGPREFVMRAMTRRLRGAGRVRRPARGLRSDGPHRADERHVRVCGLPRRRRPPHVHRHPDARPHRRRRPADRRRSRRLPGGDRGLRGGAATRAEPAGHGVYVTWTARYSSR